MHLKTKSENIKFKEAKRKEYESLMNISITIFLFYFKTKKENRI